MRNLRYTIFFFVCALITSTQSIFSNSNASKYYTDHTRKFLGFLGHKNPLSVPIRKIDKNDEQHETTHNSGLSLAGYTDGKAIYLNEDFFAKNHTEGINLFTCAHEAAHYVLKHPQQKKRSCLEIEKEADIYAARMLCKNNYKWVVKDEVRHLKQLVNTGQGHLTDGKHPTIHEQYIYLSKILENNRKGNLYRETLEEIKDLLREFNGYSRQQKIAMAAALCTGFISNYWARQYTI